MPFCCKSGSKDTRVMDSSHTNDVGFQASTKRSPHRFKEKGGPNAGSIERLPTYHDYSGDHRQESTETDTIPQVGTSQHKEQQIAFLKNEIASLKSQMRKCEDDNETLRHQQTSFDEWSNQPTSEYSSKQGPSYGNRTMDQSRMLGQSTRHSDMAYSMSEYQRLKSDMTKLDEDNMTLQVQLMQCREEKEDLQNRLSEYVSTKIADNNPRIVNIGDRNRPEKLAERFAELYDNQWTNAFEFLHDHEGKAERAAIQYLLKLVEIIFYACEEKARNELSKTKKSILKMIGMAEIPEHMATHMKMYKEERKKNFVNVLPCVQKVVHTALKTKNHVIYAYDDNAVQAFVDETTELCWLMCIQDPPMVLDINCQPGEKFDKKKFKHYTNTGKTVAYLVWPAVCLCQGGSVILKGIVQGQRKKNMLGKSVGEDKEKNKDVHSRSSHVANQDEMDRKPSEKTRVFNKVGKPAHILTGTQIAFHEASGTTHAIQGGTSKTKRNHGEGKTAQHTGMRSVKTTDKSLSLSDTWPDRSVVSKTVESDERPRSSIESARRQNAPYNDQDQIPANSLLSVTSLDNESYENAQSVGGPRPVMMGPT